MPLPEGKTVEGAAVPLDIEAATDGVVRPVIDWS